MSVDVSLKVKEGIFDGEAGAWCLGVGVRGPEKNVLCRDWKEKFVQGQSWTVTVGINKL